MLDQNGAHIIAQHSANFSLVTSGNPAKPGEYLIMYLVGMGVTSPSVASGAVSPTSPPASVAVQPNGDPRLAAVHHCLRRANPVFCQINFQVPPNATPGELEVDVIQNGIARRTRPCCLFRTSRYNLETSPSGSCSDIPSVQVIALMSTKRRSRKLPTMFLSRTLPRCRFSGASAGVVLSNAKPEWLRAGPNVRIVRYTGSDRPEMPVQRQGRALNLCGSVEAVELSILCSD
jgi:hypothetical protein